VREDESGITFVLSDGSSVTGDIAVVAIGCIPNVDWLANSGLDITNGVLCDSNGVAAPHVYAAGDVARWSNPITKKAMRLENQTSALLGLYLVGGSLTTAILIIYLPSKANQEAPQMPPIIPSFQTCMAQQEFQMLFLLYQFFFLLNLKFFQIKLDHI
jgi:hypothetical protein